jgi:hypothetical protein
VRGSPGHACWDWQEQEIILTTTCHPELWMARLLTQKRLCPKTTSSVMNWNSLQRYLMSHADTRRDILEW